MTKSSFWHDNQAYIYTALGLGVVGFIFVNYLMIIDWGYLFHFLFTVMTGGGMSGELTQPTTMLEQMKNAAFGASYHTIAPEIIRASNERQEYIFYVFVAEIAIFALLYIKNGRLQATITRPDDLVTVFTPFQRMVIWLNIGMVVMLIITGFNITWGLRSEGGLLPRYLRMFHELTGLLWIVVWATFSVIAAKDFRYMRNKSLTGIFLAGGFKPSKRIVWFFFVVMGGMLVTTGLIMILLHPSTLINAQTIQFKRALLYSHFGGSVLLMFFVLDYVYASAVSVKGYLRGLWSGKYPREYLEQVAPDVLDDLKSQGRA